MEEQQQHYELRSGRKRKHPPLILRIKRPAIAYSPDLRVILQILDRISSHSFDNVELLARISQVCRDWYAQVCTYPSIAWPLKSRPEYPSTLERRMQFWFEQTRRMYLSILSSRIFPPSCAECGNSKMFYHKLACANKVPGMVNAWPKRRSLPQQHLRKRWLDPPKLFEVDVPKPAGGWQRFIAVNHHCWKFIAAVTGERYYGTDPFACFESYLGYADKTCYSGPLKHKPGFASILKTNRALMYKRYHAAFSCCACNRVYTPTRIVWNHDYKYLAFVCNERPECLQKLNALQSLP